MADIPIRVVVQQVGRELLQQASAELRQVAAAEKEVAAEASKMGSTMSGAGSSGAGAFQQLAGGAASGAQGVGLVEAATAGAIGAVLTLAVTAIPHLIAGFRDLVESGAKYESTLTRIQVLTGAQPQVVEQWKESLLGLSGDVGKGPQELAEALYFVASAGQTGASALEIVRQAAMASAVGLGTTQDVARLLTSAMNAYGAENLSAARAADILTATVREGGAEADAMAGSMGRVVAIASTFGISFEEVGAFVATFTRVNGSAAEAVTSLRAVILSLSAPSKETREEFNRLGLSVEDVNKSIRERGLMITLRELVDMTHGNAEALDKLIPNVRGLAGALSVAGQQGSVYEQTLGKIKDSHGTLDEAFSVTSKTLTQRWEVLKSSASAFGQELAGPLVQALNTAWQGFENLHDGVKLVGDLMPDFGITFKQAMDFTMAGMMVKMIRVELEYLVKAIQVAADWAGKKIFPAEDFEKSAAAVRDMAAATQLAGHEVKTWAEAQLIIAANTNKGRDAQERQTAGLKEHAKTLQEQAALNKAGNDMTDVTIRKTLELNHNQEILDKASKTLGKSVTDLTVAKRVLGIQAEVTGKSTKKFGDDTKKAFEDISGAKADTTMRELSIAMKQFGDMSKASTPALEELHKKLSKLTMEGAPGAAKALKEVTDILTDRIVAKAQADFLGEPFAVQLRTAKQEAQLAAQSLADVNSMLQQQAKVSDDAADAAARLRNAQAPSAGMDSMWKLIDAKQSIADAQAEVREHMRLNDELLKRGIIKKHLHDQTKKDLQDELNGITGVVSATDKWLANLSAAVFYLDAALGLADAFAHIGEDFAKATDSASTFERALGGAKFGEKIGGDLGKTIGMAVGGPMGAAIGEAVGKIGGAIIGGLAGIFHKPAWVDIGKDAGKILGMEVSKELAKTIEATMKDLHVDVGAATLLNLDKAMEASGKAASTFGPQVVALFAGIATGAIPATLGIEQIDKAFTAMVAEADAAGNHASDAMLSIIEMSAETGIHVKAVTEYVKSQVTDGAAGIAAMFTFLGQSADSTAEDFQRVGVFALAAVDALQKQGLGILEIFQIIGPALDAAAQAAQDAGIELTGEFATLVGYKNLITDNKELVASVQGTAAVIKMLFNTGSLGAAEISAVLAQTSKDYADLIDKGFTVDQTLAMQAPTLKELNRLYKEGKIQLDEETLAHIRAAEAAGLLDPTPQEQMADAMDQLNVTMALLAQKMGVDLPDAIKKSIDKWEELNRVAGQTPGPPGAPPPPDGEGGGGGGHHGQAARGLVVTAPQSGMAIDVHGHEVIAPVTALFGELGNMIAAKVSAAVGEAGGAPISITMPIYLGANKLDEILMQRNRAGMLTFTQEG